jgi:hypothetical protein
MRVKPRCFVAMAFNHEDTDALYEGAILPVLKANEIVPVIINRRENNRDINHQIIEQLNACDFCITDLTYTRPSVYFEAGYAARAVEVIYTVRSDHLLRNQPDDLRVHFDLQMKPLIKWASPKDKTFPHRLERRLRSTVLRSWRNSQKEIQKQRGDRDDFANMALTEKLKKLREAVVSTVRRFGFSKWAPFEGPFLSLGPSVGSNQILASLVKLGWVMSERRKGRLLHVASVRIEESLTLKKLRDEFYYKFISSRHPPHLEGFRMIDEPSPVNLTIEHHLLGSIRPVPEGRIMSAMPLFKWDSLNSRYLLETEWKYRGNRWRSKGKGRSMEEVQLTVSRVISVHLIDGIQSLPEFKSQIRNVAKQIGGT